MALQVWLPLTKDLRNQGLGSIQTTNNTNFILKSGGKLGALCLDLSNTVRLYSPNLINLKTFSFAFWYRPETSESTINWNDVIGFNDSKGGLFRLETSYSNSYMLSMHNNTQYGIIQNVGASYGNTLLLSSASYSRDVWYHIAVTVEENDNVKAYVNGELKCIVARSDGSITGYFNLGELGGSNKEDGSLNDLRIYDHCLSPMEVKQLSQGLILHYPLNRQGWGQENLYTTSQDFSGSWNSKSNWTTSVETYQDFVVKQKSTVWGGLSQNIPCSNGDIFTISFYAKVDTGGRICSIHRSSLGNVTTGLTILGGNFSSGTDWVSATDDGTQWKRYWGTVQITSSDITYLQWRIENSIANKTLYICGMKMERGSIATPWCPNSSDELATTMGLNSTTEYDCSGFCNNGTRTGTFTWTSDTPKYAVSTHIGATSQKIHISNFPTSGFGNSYSFAWWGKRSSNSPMFWGFSDGIRLNGMYLGTLWNTGDSSNNPIYKPNTTTTITAPSTGVWHHYVMTGDGTTCKLYLDGELYGQAKTYKAISGTSIYINGWDSGTQYCSDNTDISDFRIYATALSATDVKSLYQNCATIDPDGTIRGQIRS